MEVSDSPGARPGSSFTHAPYHRHRKKYTSNLATGECSLSKFCVCVYACVCVCVRLCLRLCACLCVRGLCVYMSVSGGCPNQDPKQLFRRVREGTVSGARSEGRSGGRPGGRPEGRSGARSGGRSGGRPEGRSVPRSYNCCLAGTILARIALLSRLAACAAPMCSRAVLQSKHHERGNAVQGSAASAFAFAATAFAAA